MQSTIFCLIIIWIRFQETAALFDPVSQTDLSIFKGRAAADRQSGRCGAQKERESDMKRSVSRGIACILSAAVILGTASGCSRQENREKTVIKILYSNNFKEVEDLVESTYDDIDLQVEISPYSSEQIRRLEKGVGPDLVFTPQPDSTMVQEYLLDLSDTKASEAYDGTIMNAWKQNGKTYLIPLPGVYSGYVVNETLFEQAGLSLPANNTELVSALSEMRKKGIGVGEDDINFSIMSDYNTSVGMFYVGCMVPDFLGTVEGVKWLADFKNKEAAFSGVWEQSFSLSDSLVNAGVMDPAAIGRQRNSILCQERLVDGTLAAAFGDSALYYECVADNEKAVKEGTGTAYTYRMLPFFSDKGNEPWFLFAPSALMGINKNTGEEKQEACRRILELLSTQEGQDALIADLGGGTSCLRDHEQPVLIINQIVELEPHLAVVLEKEQFQVDSTTDAETVLDRIQAAAEHGSPYEFCFVKWDFSEDMPALISNIRQAARNDRLKVVLTGRDQDELDDAASLCGADATLCRPVFHSDIAGLMARLTGQNINNADTQQQTMLDNVQILAAEDNEINLYIAVSLLTEAGAAVTTAQNGREAVERFSEAPEGFFDLILMDIQMPVMDGYSATRAIRALPRADAQDIIIIAMTANSFREDVQKCLDSGMNAHIAKPFVMNDITKAYTDSLAEREKRTGQSERP